MTNSPKDAKPKRSPADELRLAQKAFHNARHQLDEAQRNMKYATARLDKAFAAVGEKR
jgi:hypothetical protein